MKIVTREGMFIVEGGIGDLNEKIFKQLKEEVNISSIVQADAIEEAGGVPPGVKVKNNMVYLNEENGLLRSRIIFEVNL